MFSRQDRRSLLFLIVLEMIILFVGEFSLPKVSPFKLEEPGGKTREVLLPYRVGSAPKAVFHFSGELNLNSHFGSTRFHIIPDDCIQSLEINGISIPVMSSAEFQDRCNYTQGVVVDLGEWLHPGVNQIKIAIENLGGASALEITPVHSLWGEIFLYALVYFLGSLIAWKVFSFFKMEVGIRALFIGALLVFLVYLSKTHYAQRSYDIEGHLDHIHYLVKHRWFPPPNTCVECHQLPIYYIAAASLYAFGQWMNWPNLAEVLQSFSLLLYLLFVVAGLLVLREVLEKRNAFFLAAILWIFWPAGFLQSARITNDILYYLFATISLFYLVRWCKDRKTDSSMLASFFAGLALLTKATGLLSIALCAMTFAWNERKNPRQLLVRYWKGFGILVAAVLFAFVFLKMKNENGILGPPQLPEWVRVGNGWKNYFVFDLPTYLSKPSTSPGLDSEGRQYFWNYYLRSSLTGEFAVKGLGLGIVSRILGVLLLLFMVYGALGLFALRNKKKAEAQWVMVWFLVLGPAATLYFRYTHPYSCNQDFRYVFCVVLGFIFLTIFGITGRKSLRWRIPGVIGVFAFALSSAVLYLGW